MIKPASPARSLWIRHDDGMPARERLGRTVATLTRARRLQVLVDHGFAGLLAGLGLATLAVLMARLTASPYSPWQLTCAAVFIALAVALLLGWLRRPGALEVAIRADLALKLKQRLSTAWEFMTVHGDDEVAERLAAQAVKAGLPPRPGLVFPLQVNRWGRLAPLAATALLLVSVLDLNRIQAPAPHEVDEQVIDEGQRLSAFGREMQARARRDDLPRSVRQAEQLERLGARMEGGALSRGRALALLRRMGESLDDEAMHALADANRNGMGPLPPDGGARSPKAPGIDPRAMLERMLRGALDSHDTAALGERLVDLERAGIPRGQAEEALERHRAGDNERLKEMLEKLAQIERAWNEQKELRSAREQVRRAQDNLGERRSRGDAGHGPWTDADEDEDKDRARDGGANASADKRAHRQPASGASRSGTQGDSSVASDGQPGPSRPRSGDSAPILKPQSRLGEGAEFVAQGKALPRSGRPSVENVQMSSEFAPQVEEVLSREQYPAHYKEFIRRYFLNLSQGARASQQQPPGTR